MNFRSANKEGVRQNNRASVMALIHEHDGIDRTELASFVGVTNAAITNIVNELMRAELVEEVESKNTSGNRGRKRVGLKITDNGGFVLGITVLATNASVTLANLNGSVVDEVSFYPTLPTDPFNTLDEIAEHSVVICARHNIPNSKLLGVGFAIAGFLNEEAQTLESAPYLGWPKFDLRHELTKRFRKPLAIENVARCIAFAETRTGNFVGANSLVVIRAALGLGGAIVSDGHLMTGFNNLAGDFGHMAVQRDGNLCSCGQRGCLNTIASGWAVMNRLGINQGRYKNISQFRTQDKILRDILDEDDDEFANKADVISETGSLLAEHSVNLLQALDTEFCLLTGPLGRHHLYATAFRNRLVECGFKGNIVLGNEVSILTPATASVGLALSKLVFAPSLNIDALVTHEPNFLTA
ncbi:ROK family transcriptional regulator [Alphaproteobacteria bacterium]|nr:ROK family transcriptional regulator [Alphaproteobacteria bacterium]